MAPAPTCMHMHMYTLYGPKMTQSSTPAGAVATAAPPKCASTNLASMRAVGTGLS